MIRDTLKKIVETDDEIYSIVGIVVKIDANARTCDVAPIDYPDAILYDVRLQSAIGNENGVVIFPTLKSEVVVTMLNQKTGYVAVMSDIDNISVQTATVNLKDEIAALYALLDNQNEIIKSLRLTTPQGITVGVFADSLAKIELQKKAIERHKNTVKTLFK
jgi:hypothetical protein